MVGDRCGTAINLEVGMFVYATIEGTNDGGVFDRRLRAINDSLFERLLGLVLCNASHVKFLL